MKKISIANQKAKELNDNDYDLFWKFYDQIEFQNRLLGHSVITEEDRNEWKMEAYEELVRYKTRF